MPLTLGTCNSRAGAAARESGLRYPGRRHPDACVFLLLEQRLHEKGRVTPTAHVKQGCPKDCTGHQAKMMPNLQLWRESRGEELGLSQLWGRRSTS
jgi:hypothetical protein